MTLAQNKSIIASLISIFLSLVFVAQPVFHDGLFHVYDNVQVTRVIDMASELKGGQFPVRYSSSLGHTGGYFLFHFNSPLIYYLGAAIHLLGFTPIHAVKLVYLIFITIGTTGMFLLLRFLFRLLPATLGTISFILAPYVYHDLFHRGSLAESASFMLTPLVLYGFLRLRQNGGVLNLFLSAISLALSLTAHALAGGMALIFVGFTMILKVNTRYLAQAILAIFLSFCLSAFYLIPSFVDTRHITYQHNPFVTNGYLAHPVSVLSQFGNLGVVREPGAFLGFSLTTGLILLIISYLLLPSLRHKHQFLALFAITSSIAGIFLMSPLSRFVWEGILYLRFVQFPFRFLTMVTVTAVISYTLLLHYFLPRKPIFIGLIALMIFSYLLDFRYYQPLGYQYGTDYRVEDPCRTTAWASEHLPKDVVTCLKSPPSSLLSPITQDLVISDVVVTKNGRDISFRVSGAGEVILGKYYFPMWHATLNDQPLVLGPVGENGLIKLVIPSSGELRVYLGESLLMRLCNYLSLFSWSIAFFSVTLSLFYENRARHLSSGLSGHRGRPVR